MKKYLFPGLLSVLLLASCSNESSEPKAKPPEAQETVNPVEPEKNENEVFARAFPLTGIGTNDEAEQRPVAVMVNNHPQARPQSGLHKADIVYEALAEGEITRFLAVFQSEQPEIIGPVRSAREYYINLSNGYDAIYICHGWSPQAKTMLEAGGADFLNGLFYDGSLFWRADFRKAPHNSYISFSNILKGAEKTHMEVKRKVEPFEFLNGGQIESLQGNAASKVHISYSKNKDWQVEYRFNTESQKYERFSAGVQTVDRESETPILLDNVMILEMKHFFIDNAGRRGIDLESGGQGYLLQRGLVQKIDWKNVNGRAVPFLNGKPAGLVPGKTWVNIVPASPGLGSSVSIEE